MAAEIKMIVCDLDGTLLHDDERLIDETVDTLRACREAGIRVVFATARSFSSAEQYLIRADVQDAIVYGGARVYAQGRWISSHLIEAETADMLIGKALCHSAVKAVTLAGENGYLTNDAGLIGRGYNHYRYSSFTPPARQRAYKIGLHTDDAALLEFKAAFADLAVVSYTGEDIHTFSHARAVKHEALCELAAVYGIGMEEIAVFGNDMNDCGMFKMCGTAIAVENAIDEVKAYATGICLSNMRDGVSKWLRENML